VGADLELVEDGRLRTRITNWVDRRFDSDPDLWAMLRDPEERLLASPRPGGYVLVTERWPDSASRELMMRRYLGTEQRAHYERLNPLAQRAFLLGRIAANDAVRHRLWSAGQGDVFPVEVTITNDEHGRPLARGPFAVDLRVSLAHADGVGVAIVAEGQDVGIDVEEVAPRHARFADLTLTAAEQDLPPTGEPEAWLTRLWAAKEAAAKAAGTGLQGRPKDFEVRAVDGDRLLVGERWIATELLTITEEKEHVVAWTDHLT
jgi:phosphopantetheinyl transferase